MKDPPKPDWLDLPPEGGPLFGYNAKMFAIQFVLAIALAAFFNWFFRITGVFDWITAL